MPPLNPITRIERVALQLDQVADQMSDLLGADNEQVIAFRNWVKEIDNSVKELTSLQSPIPSKL